MKLISILESWKKPKFWYHGTIKRRYDKIIKDKVLKPSLADNEEFGEGIWFADNFKDAKDYANSKGYGGKVFALDSKFLEKFKYVYTVNAKTRKEFDLGTDLVVKEKIPLKFLKVVDKPLDNRQRY